VVERVKGLYKQPGSDNWHFEFEVTVNGAPFRVRRSSGTTDAKQALALKAKLKEQYKQRAVASAVGFTTMRLHEALERYGKQMLRADANKFVSVAKRLVVAFGANTLLDDISTERITAWTEQMLLGGKLMPMKGGRQGQKKTLKAGLKPGSINRYLIMLRAVLRKAHRKWKTLAVLPVIELVKNKSKKEKLFITAAEEQKLLLASPTYLRNFLQFLLGTGARKMEACNLVWDNVFNLQSNAEYAEVKFEHNPDEGRTTKSGESRMVPLPQSVRELLIRIRAWQREIGYTGSYVFVRNDRFGEIGPHKYISQPFEDACERTGVKGVTLHTMRHTYASRLVMAGEPLLNVKELLGHASIVTTQIYAHLAPNSLAASVAKLDAFAAAAAA
jgi:integrase